VQSAKHIHSRGGLKVIHQSADLLKPEVYLSVVVQLIAVISLSIFSALAMRFVLMIELVTGGLIGLGVYVGLVLLVDPPPRAASIVNSIKAIRRKNYAGQFVTRYLQEPMVKIREVSKWLRQDQHERLTKIR
jgi:hypothetical protein